MIQTVRWQHLTAYFYHHAEPAAAGRLVSASLIIDEGETLEKVQMTININNMLRQAIPILASLNTEETVKFYTEKLGFTFHSEWDGYLLFSRDEIEIHLWPTDNPEYPKMTGCYVRVDEVDKLYEEYTAQGVIHPNGKLTDQPWEMRQFSILDNNGNIIHFGQPLAQ